MKSRAAGSRGEAIDWHAVGAGLDAEGWAVLPRLLSAKECDATANRYANDENFRSRVVMARHGFGRGEYKYFAYPLPPWSRSCAPPSIHTSRPWPIAGTKGWG